MVLLEHEGYITRPHTSAGSIPLDKGYRSYVSNLGEVMFPLDEQRLVNHLFHQVEQEINGWLNLAATLTARMVHNISVVTMPSTESCMFKHLELVSLQDNLALVVLVLQGAKVRQKLINFDQPVTQAELTVLSAKMNEKCSGLTGKRIKDLKEELDEPEKMVTDYILKLMETEDTQVSQRTHWPSLETGT